jgi:hypothetical protein
MTAASLTPGIARRFARSCWVVASGSARLPIPVICTRTISSSTTPLSRSIFASRSRIKNTALHTIAHVNAISSTISAVAVRWRRSVDRMGTTCMVVLSAT